MYIYIYIYVYIYIYIHTYIIWCGPASDRTGVRKKKNTPPDKTGWRISFENTKSGAGLQFLPQDPMTKACNKCVFSQTPVSREPTRCGRCDAYRATATASPGRAVPRSSDVARDRNRRRGVAWSGVAWQHDMCTDTIRWMACDTSDITGKSYMSSDLRTEPVWSLWCVEQSMRGVVCVCVCVCACALCCGDVLYCNASLRCCAALFYVVLC